MKYIATTNLSGLNIHQGDEVDRDGRSAQNGFAPVRVVKKDRSKPKVLPKTTFWQKLRNAFS